MTQIRGNEGSADEIKKIELLKNFSEAKLIEQVLIPLFEKMGFNALDSGNFRGGRDVGYDVILKKEDSFGDYTYTFVEIKKGVLGSSRIESIIKKLSYVMDTQFVDTKRGAKVRAYRAIIVLIGRISTSSHRLIEKLSEKKLLEVRIIDVKDLAELIDKYLPDFFYKDGDLYADKYGIVGKSAAIRKIMDYVNVIAKSYSPVLITGETGTGKELIARAIHLISERKGAFVAVNISGLDEILFSDTLFGHVKGAFTGAMTYRRGLVEKANNGTLFLDEIGDISIASQVKLLWLIQEGSYYPLGDDRPRKVNLKIIAATNKDLEQIVKEGKFRGDLYFRLNRDIIHIPPLRERLEDIPLLVDYFIKKTGEIYNIRSHIEISNKTMDVLKHYSWPGNIRELEHFIYKCAVFPQNIERGIFDIDDFVWHELAEKMQIHTSSPQPESKKVDRKVLNQRTIKRKDHHNIVLKFFEDAGFYVKEKYNDNEYLIYSNKPGFKKYAEVPVKLFHEVELLPNNINDFYTDCVDRGISENKIAFITIPPLLDNSVTLQMFVHKSQSNFTIVPFTLYNIEKALQKSRSAAEISETIRLWKGEGDIFDNSSPIRDPLWFFGREKVIDEIGEYLQALQFVGVFGLRKMGKTSLIHQLMNRMRSEIIAYIDLQIVSPNISSLFSRIANEFISEIKLKYPGVKLPRKKRFRPDSKDILSNFSDFIYELHVKVRKFKKHIKFLLFIDEIDKLLPDGKSKQGGFQGYELFLNALRGLSQNYGFLVTIVSGYEPNINCAVLPGSPELDNPMYNFFNEIYLSYFERAELEEMICRMGTQTGVTFTSQALNMIYQETSGHPYLARLLCSAIMKVKNKKIKISVEDVRKGIELFFYSAFHDSGRRELKRIWQSYLSEEEKDILKMVGKERISVVELSRLGEIANVGYNRLQCYGILTEKNKKMEVTPKLLKDFLVNQGYI